MILKVDEPGHTNMSTSVYSHHFNNLIIKRRRGKWLQQIYNMWMITSEHRDEKGSIGQALCLDKIFYLQPKASLSSNFTDDYFHTFLHAFSARPTQNW